MTIYYSDWQMTSDLTGEAAHRVADGRELGYRRDVILAARAIVDADELGMPVEQVQQVLQGRREH
ncbi:hypothetical protein ACFVUS_04065 [Nocardia sp. NPDC058058]|uniref:hypothetical protein n=1 Tax=Nocardia sp. NPDC058058 TaxID=3346317 RepID=UPI0036D87A26